mmetsp:Transcript_4081/g.11821  ORF Transcript_4081/g.11821 Transcript_4081/m.11821 type:complete len:206 (-) Transcript_4081:207-824(-)
MQLPRSGAGHRRHGAAALAAALAACSLAARGLGVVFVGSPSARPSLTRSAVALRAEEIDAADCKGNREGALTGVILPPMEEDDPAWLAFVMARYLDEEWMELPVHDDIGKAVGKLYTQSRVELGEDDLIAVLATMSYGLKDIWRQAGFLESFEGPIDVANRCAELLMLRQGKKVWSYGLANDEVQEQMLKRLAQYDEKRAALKDA